MSFRILFRGAAGLTAGLVIGNATILAATRAARRRRAPALFPGIDNSRRIDDRIWAGAAPGRGGYSAVAAAGATTVVDLRAEGGEGPSANLGLDHRHLPIRDGQPPSPAQVAAFLAIVDAAPGPVFVHCAAGVGRTGSMVAAYRALRRGATRPAVVAEMLAVGPPSLEQIAFAAGIGAGRRPGPLVIALSRVLDAPRRTWSRLRQALWRGAVSCSVRR